MLSFHTFSQRTCLVFLRLCKHSHVISLATPLLFSRTMASSSPPSSPPLPAERGTETTDKLPSHAILITKTGTAILGSGLLATAISQELCVFNEETVIAVGYFILFAYIAKVRTLPWRVNFSFIFLCIFFGRPFGGLNVRGMSLHFSLVVESNRMDADRNMHAYYCRPSAFRARSGRRTTMLASRAYATARVTSTHRL
jgi:hypothetical protein